MGNKKKSSRWKELSKICNGVNEENWFDKNINWVVGNGQSIRLCNSNNTVKKIEKNNTCMLIHTTLQLEN